MFIIFINGLLVIQHQVAWVKVKNHMKSGQECPDLERSGFQMVGTIAMVKAIENVQISNFSTF